MSRFYGSVQGSAATEATRQGTAESGVMGHIRGWDIGIEVEMEAAGDQDIAHVTITRGSNGRRRGNLTVAGGEYARYAFTVTLDGGKFLITDVGDVLLDTASAVLEDLRNQRID